jgi:hypothetical protein
MAKHMFWNALITINGVDLSDHIESIEVPVANKELPAAGMGDTSDYNIPGIASIGDFKCTFYQDYEAGSVYQTIFPLWRDRTLFPLTIKADHGATSTVNPLWSLQVFVKTFALAGGKHGERHMASITFSTAGLLTTATT